MTNHWADLQHCKTILVEGSNVAENHPMAFKWIRQAQENGAVVIHHVDPRFSRTSAAADMFARIRPGADAAFLNTMINHILVHKRYDEDYLMTHTNALFVGDANFDFKDGLFSGYDQDRRTYDTSSWGYQLDTRGRPQRATSLDDPRCIFARLRTFFSRYTLEIGERISGVPAAQIQQIAETMAKNRPGSILYALGMTQHTTGVQGIRPDKLLEQCRALHAELRSDQLSTVLTAAFDEESVSHRHGGLRRYLEWALLVRHLRPVVAGFAAWRDEERWLRNYCPTCGSPPAMGQLVGKDPGRLRLLSCGCCRWRWRYRRTGCPFCDVHDEQRLAVVGVEGEEGLRIDYCEACRGYLKTYDGQGSEDVLLADWTSLHLDVIAADRGLKRLAASLYEM